jgi:hypothetical protein
MLSAEGQRVRQDLRLGGEHAAWLDQLDELEAAGDRGQAGQAGLPPAPDRVGGTLARLGVADDDAAAIIATRPELDRSPSLRWLLRRCVSLIADRMGDAGAPSVPLPQLPAALGAAGRCFPAHLFLAAMPATLAWHRRQGIPPETSWATFADLGRHMAIYRTTHGMAGVDEPWWLMLHLQGLIYELGRLQYNLLRLGAGSSSPGAWYDRSQAGRLGIGFRPGDDGLGVHIPQAGPLTPASCDESMAAARPFFDRHFPSPTRRIAICESWLLDDQLSHYLPAGSNIVQFQRRFTLTPTWSSGDKDITQFVFRRSEGDLAGVPQGTVLERAVVTHLRAGRHWRLRCGWVRL